MTVAGEVAGGALLRCSVAGFEPHRTVFLATLPRTPLSPVAASFVALMREQHASDEPVDQLAAEGIKTS